MAEINTIFLYSLFILGSYSLLKRPIIGVLTQSRNYINYDTHIQMRKLNHSKFIDGTYVKFIESSGCLAMAIDHEFNVTQMEEVFKSINGVILPGGSTPLDFRLYQTPANMLFNLANEYNSKNSKIHKYFPVMGICLGFQAMVKWRAPSNPLIECDAHVINLKLDFKKDSSFIPKEFHNFLSKNNVTANFHRNCVRTDVFNSDGDGFFQIISTSYDRTAMEFVSTIEGKYYPYIGFQWHPEKPTFSYDSYLNIDRSTSSIFLQQAIINRFSLFARSNKNPFNKKFSKYLTVNMHLITTKGYLQYYSI